MTIGKAFVRGFKEGWHESWSKLTVGYVISRTVDAGIIILFWELFNGRLL